MAIKIQGTVVLDYDGASYSSTNIAVGASALASITTGGYNVGVGYRALYNNTTGVSNVGVGYTALYSNTIGINNVGVGVNALYNNTTGNYNVGVGYTALYSNTTGTYNTGIGQQSLYNNTTGNYNVGVGMLSLLYNTIGTSNVGVGYAALYANTTGNYNVGVGYGSLQNNTTGINNVGVGYTALFYNTIGVNNTGIGYQSLYSNTTGTSNTGVGMQSLQNNTTGTNNVGVGYGSLQNNTIGISNVGVGFQSLYTNTTGTSNTSVGIQSLYSNTIGTNNTAVGIYALYNNTTGVSNVGVGTNSLYYNTIGTLNTAVGYQSLYYNTTGITNTAVGYGSLQNNTVGINNTGIGYGSLISNTTGTKNSALGFQSLYFNTTGINNTGIGYQALYSNTTGVNNTAVGVNALFSNTIGVGNTGVGIQSLFSNTTGANNTGIGLNSLYYNTIGISNVGVGHNALVSNTTGEYNIGVGVNALYNNTIGNQNVGVGVNALYNNTTGSYNVVVGVNAFVSNTTGESNVGVGHIALYNNTIGIQNVGVGFGSLYSNTTGNFNVGVGYAALYYNTTGEYNVGVGYQALNNNTIGNQNVGVGVNALYSNTTGTSNVGVGYFALYDQTTAQYNTAIGYNTGRGITTGSYNTIIGAQVTGLSATLNNTVIIADGAGNQRIYADSSGNVGIGTSVPGYKLTVAGLAAFGAASGVYGNNADMRLETATGYGWRMGTTSTGSTHGYFYIQGSTDNFVSSFINGLNIDTSGKVGIGTATPSAGLDVVPPNNTRGIETTVNDTVADQSFFAHFLDVNISGDDTCTTDRSHIGLYLDIDSTATGGDVDNEHRIYGSYVDVDVTGDSDIIYGTYNSVRSTHSSGTISDQRASYNIAEADGSGTVTSLYGSANYALSGTTVGSPVNAYGTWSKYLKEAADSGTTTSAYGLWSEVEIDGGTITNAYGVRSIIDYDGGTIGNGYLLHGSFEGSSGTRWGVYITGESKNYFSGDVGIGTAAPAQRLEVKDLNETGFKGVRVNNPTVNIGSAGIEFQVDATYSKAAIYQTRKAANGNGDLIFAVDSASDAANWVAADEKMRITSGGSVGIGYSAPESWYGVNTTLLVNRAQNADTMLGIGNSTAGAAAATSIYMIGGTGNSWAKQTLADNTGSPYFASHFGSAVTFVKWDFNGTERMRIDSSGNVGIGTNSPSSYSPFTVAKGTAYVNQNIASIGDSSMGRYLRIHNVTSGGNTRTALSAQYDANDSNYFDLLLNPNGGKVGIGTSSPSQLLHVNGIGYASTDFRAPKFYDSNNTAFYVDPASTSVVNTVTYSLLTGPASNTRDKIRVWSTTPYSIGMQASITFGSINNDYAMTFQMSNTNARGFWWGDSGHTTAQGAMAVSTDGKLTVAHSIRVGHGVSDTTVPGATYRLDVSGDIGATGNITAYYSDERLKTKLGNISKAVDIIKYLNGFRYINNETAKSFGYDSDKIQVGVSAQEVERVLPEIVSIAPFDAAADSEGNIISKTGNNYKTVDYSKLVPVLIEAIKEQQEQIETLRKEINILKRVN
jgi:hypothetical protein